jgi:DUF4097 and DUF4098 domain-containing protein YvlB
MIRRRSTAPLVLALALAALPAASAAGPREEIVRTFDKTLPLSAGQRLSIDHRNGDIRIRTHKAAEVRISAKIHGSSSDEAEIRKFLDAVAIVIEPAASGVSVRTVYPDRSWRFSGSGHVSFSVDYEIAMPESSPLDVKSRFGDVSVEGLKAAADVRNANGRLSLRDGRGAQRLENAFGPIDVVAVSGDVTMTNANGSVSATDIDGTLEVRNRFGRVAAIKVGKGVRVINGNGEVQVIDCAGAATVENSFGSVQVRNLKGSATIENTNGPIVAAGVTGAVSVRGSFGTVDLSDLGGPVEVRSANATVKVREVRGSATLKTSFGMVDCARVDGDLAVENANGAVRASDVHGAASVRTSFASVSLDGVGGRVRVDNQNGSIDVRGLASRKGKDCPPVELKTSFSSIRIALPEEAGWTVDARTSFGRIRADVAITVSGSLSTEAVQGKIGDGACPLTLSNSNGSIEILKEEKRK